jgi:RimJ/RimL family protein N-acetyltransferase
MSQISLETERLILRPHTLADAAGLARLAGAREVAATTLRIPHPYTEQDARDFIGSRHSASEAGEPETSFAITLRSDGQLCGGIGLRVDGAHHHAELGYWLGVPFWGKGYATEAARAVIDYGFDTLALHRIYASHFAHNLASGGVLRKIGMKHEGRMRAHIRKWETFHDLECFGMLNSDRVHK